MSGMPITLGSEVESPRPKRVRNQSLWPLRRDNQGKGPERDSIPEESYTQGNRLEFIDKYDEPILEWDRLY